MEKLDQQNVKPVRAYQYSEGTWTAIPTVTDPSNWPEENGYEYVSCPNYSLWTYKQIDGPGHAFVISLGPGRTDNCTLVIVDDFPSVASFLREISGHFDFWKLTQIERQTEIMQRDFLHQHHHYPAHFDECSVCAEWFDLD